MNFEEFIDEWKSEVPYIKVKTSGSTGNPKEIKLDKEFVKKSALRTNDFFQIHKDSHLYACISADTIGGKMMAVRAMLAECNFSWENPSNQPFKDNYKNEVYDLASVVPSQMLYILDYPEKLNRIRRFLIGGSALHDDLKKKIEEAGIEAYESYGMTETASHIALRKIEASEKPFKTFEDISVCIDSRGCLIIDYEGGQRIITNDLAEILSPSEFLIKGRIDDMIISGGKKINPYELEKKLTSIIPSEFVIITRPDIKWGNRIVLKVEEKDFLKSDEQLINEMKNILEPYEVPKEILRVRKLERNKGGKIIRK